MTIRPAVAPEEPLGRKPEATEPEVAVLAGVGPGAAGPGAAGPGAPVALAAAPEVAALQGKGGGSVKAPDIGVAFRHQYVENTDTEGVDGTTWAKDTSGQPVPLFWSSAGFLPEAALGVWSGGTWTNESVAGGKSAEADIVYSAAGAPWVVQAEGGSTAPKLLRYFSKGTGSWVTETISGTHFPDYVAIGEAAGEPIVLFHDKTSASLIEAVRSAGTWSTTNVESATGADHGMHVVAKANPSGGLGAAWMSDVGGKYELHYGTRSATGTWQIATVPTTNASGAWLDLDFDSSGNAHLVTAKWDGSVASNVYWVRQTGSGWQETEIGTASSVRHLSVAVDANDKPHFAVECKTCTPTLRYIEPSGSSFRDVPLPVSAGVQTAPSLTFDANGYPTLALAYSSNPAMAAPFAYVAECSTCGVSFATASEEDLSEPITGGGSGASRSLSSNASANMGVVAVAVTINHPNPSSLTLTLSRAGGSSSSIQGAFSGSGVTTATFATDGFKGLSGTANWTVEVSGGTAGQDGTLLAWTLGVGPETP